MKKLAATLLTLTAIGVAVKVAKGKKDSREATSRFEKALKDAEYSIEKAKGSLIQKLH